MAKFKLNLSGDWKSLLLAHGEKAGLAVVGLLVLFFLWSAIGQEGLPDSQEPEDLMQLAEAARGHIERTEWEAHPQRPELPQIGTIMPRLALDPYKTQQVYDPPIFPKKLKRADPQLLAPIELEVDAGYGAFAMHDPTAVPSASRSPRRQVNPRAGGLFGRLPRQGIVEEMPLIEGEDLVDEPLGRPLPAWFPVQGVQPDESDKIVGRRWIVLKALVPITKQVEEFERVFRDAEGYDPQADRPVYLAFFVERSEGTEGSWQPLATVTGTYVQRETDQWSKSAEVREVVDERYVHPRLTFPLGPLVMDNWGPEVSHSKVPLAPTEDELRAMLEQQAPDEQQPEAPKEDVPLFEQFRLNPHAEEEDPRGRGPRRSLPPARRRSVDRGMGDGALAGIADQLPPAEELLLRYFDFNVEPGKQYRYRVRLVMRDPNFHRSTGDEEPQVLPIKYLEKSVVDRISAQEERMRPFRFTEWSAASPVASPPLEQGVLAGQVDPPPPGRFNDRPKATVLVRTFDMNTGMEMAAEREMGRSATARFITEVEAVDPHQRQLIKLKQYSFDVDATLVDLRGGNRIGSRDASLVEPGELLILGPDGTLRVRSQVEDRAYVQTHRDLVSDAGALEEGTLFEGAAPPDAGLLDSDFDDPRRTRSRGR